MALLHLFSSKKITSLVFILYIIWNSYLLAIQKQAFRDPRPFVYDSRIRQLQWQCPESYGFSSGHCWMAVLLYEPVISDFIGTKGWKKLLFLFLVLTSVLMPLSRMYLGMHSADQVVTGLLYSFIAVVLYRYHIQEKIYNLVAMTLKGHKKGFIFILTTLAFLLCLSIPIILYETNLHNRSFNQTHLNNLNKACSTNVDIFHMELHAGVDSSLVSLSFGLIYGLLLSSFNEIQRKKMKYYLRGNWSFNEDWKNIMLYLLAYILIGGILLGVVLGFAANI